MEKTEGTSAPAGEQVMAPARRSRSKSAGEPRPTCQSCRRTPMTGTPWCWTHSPDISEEERREARSRGGQEAQKQHALMKQVQGMAAELEVDLSTPAACRKLLEALAKAVLVGGVTPQRSGALVQIVNAASKANELAVELALIEELEREKARS